MTREEQRAETRRRILESAQAVFGEVGFHAASIEEITDRAGFSRGAFYSNFSSKEDLFLSLAEARIGRNLSELTAMFEKDASLDVYAEIDSYVAGPQRDRPRDASDLHFQEFAFYAARNPELRARLAALQTRMRTDIAAMVTAHAEQLGFEPVFPPTVMASVEMALETGLFLQELIEPGSVPQGFLFRFLEFVIAAMKSMDTQREAAGIFTCDDFTVLSEAVAASWKVGMGRDWSVPAGILEWSCSQTADHAIDTVLAPAFFLAARKVDGYPDGGWSPGPAAAPLQFIEALETVSRILVGVVRASPPDARAVIWRHPSLEVRGPQDFPARAGLELILHAHDIGAGLGTDFEPPAEVATKLRDHTRDWPFWGGYWDHLTMGPDAWDDLLRTSGRR